MIRKIIRQGSNTLTVTLPVVWAKKLNLNAGQEINLIEKEDGLFIKAERTDKISKIEINIAGLSIPLIWKHLMVAYREGYDSIVIKFSPSEQYDSPYEYFAHNILDPRYSLKERLAPADFLQQMCRRFIGFEVIEQGKDFCILKEIVQSTNKELDSSLKRIFILILNLSEGIISDLEENKTEFLERAHEVDTLIDKFHDFCARILNKTESGETSKSYLILNLIHLLELVGDEFKHLAIQLKKKKHGEINSEKLIGLLNSINEQFRIIYELYYNYSLEKLQLLSELNRNFLPDEPHCKNNYKEDVQVTIETINRYIDVLSEVLIANQQTEKLQV